jgi:hypothetical protein
MIDRQQRDALAQALDRLLADLWEWGGPAVVDVDELLQLEPRPSSDRAANAVWAFTFELFWPDLEWGREPQLYPEAAELIGRCILFLRTDLGYAWRYPEEKRCGKGVLLVLALLIVSMIGSAVTQRADAWLHNFCVTVLFGSLSLICWSMCLHHREVRRTERWWSQVKEFWPFPDKPTWDAGQANPL